MTCVPVHRWSVNSKKSRYGEDHYATTMAGQRILLRLEDVTTVVVVTTISTILANPYKSTISTRITQRNRCQSSLLSVIAAFAASAAAASFNRLIASANLSTSAWI